MVKNEYLKGGYSSIIEKIEIKGIKKLECTWRDVYLVKLDKNSKEKLLPVDAIGLLAPNKEEIITNLMKICCWRESEINIKRESLNNFEYFGSLKSFLINHVDLTTMPKKRFLQCLIKYSTCTEGCDELIEALNDKSVYLKMVQNWVNLYDLIVKYRVKIPFEVFVEHFELNKPRYYSLMKNQDWEILVGLIENSTQSKFGHFSGFIRDLHLNKPESLPTINSLNKRKNLLESSFQSNCFTQESPLITFCTGTGIAPAISLIGKKEYYKELMVVYGFRNDEDDILKSLSINCKSIKCKSSENSYVTDEENIKIIDSFPSPNIFICGNMKMQKSVFLKIKKNYPNLIENSRIYFDNWR